MQCNLVHKKTKELYFEEEKVNPFQFAVEQLDNLRHHGVTVTGSTGGDNAWYGGVSMGKSEYYEYPCHAYMKDIHQEAQIIWSKWVIPNHSTYRDSSRAYFEWITGSQSPWGFALDMGMSFKEGRKYHNQEFWWDNGFIFDKLDEIPSNVMQNFLVASRMPKEWPQAIKLWYNIAKDGVSPEMAMVLATNFFTERSDTVNFIAQFEDPYDWPTDAVTGNEDYVRNFLSHRPDNTIFNKPYSVSHKYSPVNAIWGLARDPVTSAIRHKETPYGGKVSKSVLSNLYSKDFGKVINHGSGKWSDGYSEWRCGVKDLIEIGKQEDKRLR